MVDLGTLPVKLSILDCDVGRVIWKHQGCRVRLNSPECLFAHSHSRVACLLQGGLHDHTSPDAVWGASLFFASLPHVSAI